MCVSVNVCVRESVSARVCLTVSDHVVVRVSVCECVRVCVRESV